MTYKTLCLPSSEDTLVKAASLLNHNELVAFPTETVYGLGANALNEEAIKKIFLAKKRPMDNPLIVHISSFEQAEPLCHMTPLAKTLMETFWPGPLTLLLRKKSLVPSITTGGLQTVALRMPDHPVALSLIEKAALPIAAPSANRSGRPSPTKAAHVFEDLQGEIPLIIDGGDSSIGVESTVLDISCNQPQILRPGGITFEMLLPYCPSLTINPSVLAPLAPDAPALSPGMRYKHYAPLGNLTMVKGKNEKVVLCCKTLYDKALSTGQKAAIFTFEEHLSYYASRKVINLGSITNPAQGSSRLFDALRQMDEEGIQAIFSEVLPPKGLGLAFMNRLGRASAFHTINADIYPF